MKRQKIISFLTEKLLEWSETLDEDINVQVTFSRKAFVAVITERKHKIKKDENKLL